MMIIGYGVFRCLCDSVKTLVPSDLNYLLGNAYFYLGAATVKQKSIEQEVNATYQERQISSVPMLNAANESTVIVF
jgi:uncharacterized protein